MKLLVLIRFKHSIFKTETQLRIYTGNMSKARAFETQYFQHRSDTEAVHSWSCNCPFVRLKHKQMIAGKFVSRKKKKKRGSWEEENKQRSEDLAQMADDDAMSWTWGSCCIEWASKAKLLKQVPKVGGYSKFQHLEDKLSCLKLSLNQAKIFFQARESVTWDKKHG